MPGKCGVTALMGVDTPPMEGTWGGAGKEVVKAVFVRCTAPLLSRARQDIG